MGRRPARLSLLLAVLAAGPSPAAEVYRWTDAEGRTHFGDRPAGAGARKLEVPRTAPTADSAERLEKTRRLLQDFEASRAATAAAAAERARRAETRAQACAEARQRRFEYEHSGFLYEWDEQGQKRILDDRTHREVLERARADVAQWCD